jgi:hypothetical protein
MLSFLHQTRRRLERLDLVQDSEIFKAVEEAHRAMHGLHVTLIYLAAGHGVWKAAEKPGPTVGHGSGSITTEPSGRLTAVPQRREVWI